MVIDVNPVHREKAQSPIEVTPDGIVIEVKPSQLKKADSPIEVTDEGMVIEDKPEQPKKATFPIIVTLYVTPEYKTVDGMKISPVYFEDDDVTSTVLLEFVL